MQIRNHENMSKHLKNMELYDAVICAHTNLYKYIYHRGECKLLVNRLVIEIETISNFEINYFKSINLCHLFL
jgi:hypothetical protein